MMSESCTETDERDEDDFCSWCGYEFTYDHWTGDRQDVFWEGKNPSGVDYSCCCYECYQKYNQEIPPLTFGTDYEE